MSELEALLIGMVLLLHLLGACLAFIVWRMGVWTKQLAGALAKLTEVVHADLVQRSKERG